MFFIFENTTRKLPKFQLCTSELFFTGNVVGEFRAGRSDFSNRLNFSLLVSERFPEKVCKITVIVPPTPTVLQENLSRIQNIEVYSRQHFFKVSKKSLRNFEQKFEFPCEVYVTNELAILLLESNIIA